MLRIGVLSDTHLRDAGHGMAFLHDLAIDYFSGIDLLLHAGDVGDPSTLEVFKEIPVYAVRGNTDSADSRLPSKRIVTVEGLRIGLIHGWGAANGLEARVGREFSDAAIDCLVYGHSHQPACHRRGGMLFFNPGSPTDRRSAPFHSVGILEVGEGIRGHIVRLDDKRPGARRGV